MPIMTADHLVAGGPSGSFEPQAKDNWAFEAVLQDGSDTRLLLLSCNSIGLPNESNEDLEHIFLNKPIHYAGNLSYETTTLTIKDFVDQDIRRIIRNWRQKVYNYENGVIGLAKDYKIDAYIRTYAPDGTFERSWALRGVWPQAVNWGDLDYTIAEPVLIEVTLRYDEVIPLESLFTPLESPIGYDAEISPENFPEWVSTTKPQGIMDSVMAKIGSLRNQISSLTELRSKISSVVAMANSVGTLTNIVTNLTSGDRNTVLNTIIGLSLDTASWRTNIPQIDTLAMLPGGISRYCNSAMQWVSYFKTDVVQPIYDEAASIRSSLNSWRASVNFPTYERSSNLQVNNITGQVSKLESDIIVSEEYYNRLKQI